MTQRLDQKFASLKAAGKTAFIPFIMAGDPNMDESLALLKDLPKAGADIIELGVCFTDPMADGPAIEAAGLRALAAGQTLRKTLEMVRQFREDDTTTPIILMGYYNPFYIYGVQDFIKDALEAGVDGVIIVDLPPEEDTEMCIPAKEAGLAFIRLATPTTDAKRLPMVINNTSGFVYYVSVAGVTGGATGAQQHINQAVENLRSATDLPIAIGFGVKTNAQVKEFGQYANAVVVGSALVSKLAEGIEAGKTGEALRGPVLDMVRALVN